MIIFSGIYKKFGDTVVFDNFSDGFEEGCVNCIFAPSGSGKTTLLNMAAGLLSPDKGTVSGIPDGVSYAFQEDRLIPQKTAFGNLKFILRNIYPDKKTLEETVNRYLAEAGLGDAAELYPREMSGGMRRRLALIRAFAYPSELLLMDEPFKALDLALRKDVAGWFSRYRRTVLLVTHDPDEAFLVGDYIHAYSKKPMTLLKKFKIPGEKGGREIYGNESAEFRKRLLEPAEDGNALGSD
ncbi:MAG: ABC transporter ATP-binding protein [Clostridiales bacterium]|jgi:NitT/TauT family transport system ATP-binding protein|nr:ABC transporter ATP-binding protein [Clostridiales bacterium]